MTVKTLDEVTLVSGNTFFNSTWRKIVHGAFSFTSIVAVLSTLMLLFFTNIEDTFSTLRLFTITVFSVGVLMSTKVFKSKDVQLLVSDNFYVLIKLFLFGLLSLCWMKTFNSIEILGKYFGVESSHFALFAILCFSYLTAIVSIVVARSASIFISYFIGAKYKNWLEFAFLAVSLVVAYVFTVNDIVELSVIANCLEVLGSSCLDTLKAIKR